MEKFTTVTGIAAPLTRSNVDTDQIIPAVYLKRVTKTGFEDALFSAWRQDPEFVLNKPEFQGADHESPASIPVAYRESPMSRAMPRQVHGDQRAIAKQICSRLKRRHIRTC